MRHIERFIVTLCTNNVWIRCEMNFVISWFSSQGLDLVIFLEVEGHFCPLDCVMAIERIG